MLKLLRIRLSVTVVSYIIPYTLHSHVRNRSYFYDLDKNLCSSSDAEFTFALAESLTRELPWYVT